MLTHPSWKVARFTDRTLSQVDVRRIPRDLDEVFKEFFFRIDSGGGGAMSHAHAANVARVPGISGAHVRRSPLEEQHARAAVAGAHRRAQRSVAPSDHKDVNRRFFCEGRDLVYPQPIESHIFLMIA